MVALTYLAASYFAQGAFKETAEALFVLATALALRDPAGAPAGRWSRLRLLLPYLALAGGVFFSYSFAGLAWPVAIVGLWGLTQPAVRSALAPRALARALWRPRTLLIVLALAALGLLALIGPFGFGGGFNKVAGSNTYGPVSPVEALGVWPASNYRLLAAGGAHLSGLAGAIGLLAVAIGAIWWVRRRDLAVPLAFAACLALYLISVPLSGDYSQAKALMIGAPLAMLIAIRPLLAGLGPPPRPVLRVAWAALAVVFVAGSLYSTFLALRDAPVGPPGHDSELSAFLPIVHGQPVLYAGQDRYAAYDLLGADTHVPLVEFPDEEVSQNLEKPFDTGDAYSPIDFDSFSGSTLNRFPYVITGRAAWNSEAPDSLQGDRLDPLLRALGKTARTAARSPCAARGNRAGGVRRLRRAGDRDPHLQPRARLALPGCGDRRQTRLGRAKACSAPARARPRRSTCRRAAGCSRCSTSPPST